MAVMETTDMSLPERILSALRGDPKTLEELAEVLRVNVFVLKGSWIDQMLKHELVVRLADGRLALPEDIGPCGPGAA